MSTWDDFAAPYDFLTQGQVGVVLGESLSSYLIGGNQNHNFGDYVCLTVDYDALIRGAVGGIGPLAAVLNSPFGAAVFGLSGGATFTYGRSTTATYVGPTAGVTRGPVLGGTCLATLFGAGGPASAADFSTIAKPGSWLRWDSDEAQQTIDRTTGVVVAALSAVMILTALVLDIVLYTQVKDPDADQGPQTAAFKERVASWGVTSRIMGLIVGVEEVSQRAREAVTKATTARRLSDDQKSAVACSTRLLGYFPDMTRRLGEAWDDAEESTKIAIVVAVALTVFAAAIAATVVSVV